MKIEINNVVFTVPDDAVITFCLDKDALTCVKASAREVFDLLQAAANADE